MDWHPIQSVLCLFLLLPAITGRCSVTQCWINGHLRWMDGWMEFVKLSKQIFAAKPNTEGVVHKV